LLGLFFDPKDGGDIFPRDVTLAFNGLHGVKTQIIELFKILTLPFARY
jgi:hypothetical protein